MEVKKGNSSARVMVFDNEEIYSDLVKNILAKQNIEVTSHSNCDNLVGNIQQVMPDVILMDHDIPYIGGVEATRSIKGHPKLFAIPVIYFSARHEIERLAQQAGADTYFPKPFEFGDLEKIVRQYIEAGRKRKLSL